MTNFRAQKRYFQPPLCNMTALVNATNFLTIATKFLRKRDKFLIITAKLSTNNHHATATKFHQSKHKATAQISPCHHA